MYDRYIQCSIIPKKSLQEEMAFNIQYNCHGKQLETPLYGPHIYIFTQYFCCLCYSQFLRIVHGLKWCFDDVFLIGRLSCDLLVEGSLPTTCLLGSWNLQLVPLSQIAPNFDYRDSQDQHNHLRVSTHSLWYRQEALIGFLLSCCHFSWLLWHEKWAVSF